MSAYKRGKQQPTDHADSKKNNPSIERSESETPASPPRLEELPFAVLNRLTPSNLKKSASHFMERWEESLLSPPAENTLDPIPAADERGKTE